MKNHTIENPVSSPRRRLFGAVAGAVAGVVGWAIGSRPESPASPAKNASSAVGSSEPARAPSAGPIVVKPAPHSVKRHG